jgi:V8-like Glu-specific endopeptidase
MREGPVEISIIAVYGTNIRGQIAMSDREAAPSAPTPEPTYENKVSPQLGRWKRIVAEPPPPPDPSRDIIGRDRRTYVKETTNYPACAVCALVLDMGGGVERGATGILVGRRTVATAGHVLSDPDFGVPIGVTVIPGRRIPKGSSQPDSPFGAAPAVGRERFRISPLWQSGGNANFDYGAILLPDEIVFQDGQFGRVAPAPYYSAVDGDLRGSRVFNYGYPVPPIPDTDDGRALRDTIGEPLPLTTMWTNAGTVTATAPYRLFYDLSTTEGHSGSPIFYWDDAQKYYYLVGIHTQGRFSENGAVRITDDLWSQLEAWRRENGDTD